MCSVAINHTKWDFQKESERRNSKAKGSKRTEEDNNAFWLVRKKRNKKNAATWFRDRENHRCDTWMHYCKTILALYVYYYFINHQFSFIIESDTEVLKLMIERDKKKLSQHLYWWCISQKLSWCHSFIHAKEEKQFPTKQSSIDSNISINSAQVCYFLQVKTKMHQKSIANPTGKPNPRCKLRVGMNDPKSRIPTKRVNRGKNHNHIIHHI